MRRAAILLAAAMMLLPATAASASAPLPVPGCWTAGAEAGMLAGPGGAAWETMATAECTFDRASEWDWGIRAEAGWQEGGDAACRASALARWNPGGGVFSIAFCIGLHSEAGSGGASSKALAGILPAVEIGIGEESRVRICFPLRAALGGGEASFGAGIGIEAVIPGRW